MLKSNYIGLLIINPQNCPKIIILIPLLRVKILKIISTGEILANFMGIQIDVSSMESSANQRPSFQHHFEMATRWRSDKT